MTNEALVRYSDEDLAEFKALINAKMLETREQLDLLQAQLMDVTENSGDEHGGDWVDDSSINTELEMLNNMAIRQQKYLKDLENALVRIQNKTYGICVISGELIDKRRLLAVPTTTKSVNAKHQERKREEEKIVVHPSKTPYVKGSGDTLVDASNGHDKATAVRERPNGSHSTAEDNDDFDTDFDADREEEENAFDALTDQDGNAYLDY